MEAYAVIETGGKQYRVSPGNKVDIERLEKNEGDEVAFESVLAISDGTTLKVGTPLVEGAKVTAVVVKNFRGEKVVNFKKKRRKGYSRKIGHRQNLTQVEIKSIA
jgi:large subunit ribosomal protein L21